MNGTHPRKPHDTTPIPEGNTFPPSLRDALQARLQSLSYGAFCLLVRHVLYQSGYTSVHAVGRLYRPDALPRPGGTQFNPHHGGLDLIALSHTDLATSLTLVQVKQYQQPVPRRYIDEMRGAMDRLGAEQGLIVSSGRFAGLARDAAAIPHLRPVTPMDGWLLVTTMLTRRVGYGITGGSASKPASKHHWKLDTEFFNDFEERCRRLERSSDGGEGDEFESMEGDA